MTIKIQFRFLCFAIFLFAIHPEALRPLPLEAKTPSEPTRFLHRDHLNLPNLTCLSCHAQAAVSESSTDNLLPAPNLCKGCHDGRQAKKQESAERFLLSRELPIKLHFNHRQHLALGNVAPALLAAFESQQYFGPASSVKDLSTTTHECQVCHRGLAHNDEGKSSHIPPMADCLVCHATIEPPFSCELCHPNDANLKPPNHTADFMDTHSSQMATLDASSCKECHGIKFRCKGCH